MIALTSSTIMQNHSCKKHGCENKKHVFYPIIKYMKKTLKICFEVAMSLQSQNRLCFQHL